MAIRIDNVINLHYKVSVEDVNVNHLLKVSLYVDKDDSMDHHVARVASITPIWMDSEDHTMAINKVGIVVRTDMEGNMVGNVVDGINNVDNIHVNVAQKIRQAKLENSIPSNNGTVIDTDRIYVSSNHSDNVTNGSYLVNIVSNLNIIDQIQRIQKVVLEKEVSQTNLQEENVITIGVVDQVVNVKIDAQKKENQDHIDVDYPDFNEVDERCLNSHRFRVNLGMDIDIVVLDIQEGYLHPSNVDDCDDTNIRLKHLRMVQKISNHRTVHDNNFLNDDVWVDPPVNIDINDIVDTRINPIDFGFVD